jgi:hypothetical protein
MNLRAEAELKAKQFRAGEITIEEFNGFLESGRGGEAAPGRRTVPRLGQ